METPKKGGMPMTFPAADRPPLRVVNLQQEDVPTYHDGIVDAYAEVFAEEPWNESSDNFTYFADALLDHAEQDGFRGAVLIDGPGVVHGFALGVEWEPEHWWCSRVAEDLGPRAQTWTEQCFHLLELAVRREHRGAGHGNALYDALVSDLPHRTAILSTNRLGPVAAATLYARRGWKLLLEEWRHCDGCDPVQVLGLVEPALSARP